MAQCNVCRHFTSRQKLSLLIGLLFLSNRGLFTKAISKAGHLPSTTGTAKGDRFSAMVQRPKKLLAFSDVLRASLPV